VDRPADGVRGVGGTARVRRGTARGVAGAVDALDGSLAYCREHLDDISEYAARWESVPAERFRSYFDALQFRYEPRYREGLLRFLTEAHASESSMRCREIAMFGEDA
jgi:predicted solute-binding protein